MLLRCNRHKTEDIDGCVRCEDDNPTIERFFRVGVWVSRQEVTDNSNAPDSEGWEFLEDELKKMLKGFSMKYMRGVELDFIEWEAVPI